MVKNISVRSRRLSWAISGICMALFLWAAPVSASETPPAPPETQVEPAAPAIPPIPSELTPEALAALSPEEKLERAEALSAAAFFRANQALADGNIALAQEALDLIDQASALDCDVAKHSAEAKNVEHAQMALNVSLQIAETLNLILAAAANIASTSTDADTVAAANVLQGKVATAQQNIVPCQEIAIAAGASLAAAEEAYESPAPGPAPPAFNPPVVDAEPPISDLPPASPV